MQGYLYVEAHKESHVTDATRGLRIIYHSKGARLVPFKEMVSAIYVNQQAKSQLGKCVCPVQSLQSCMGASVMSSSCLHFSLSRSMCIEASCMLKLRIRAC